MARYYQNIRAYHLAYNFVLAVYERTKSFPKSEESNLRSQLRRAAVSLPLNIAEGSAKSSKKEFLYFLGVAYASAKEVEVLLSLCFDLGYFKKSDHDFLSKSLDEFNAKLFLFMRDIESRVTGNRTKFFRKFEGVS